MKILVVTNHFWPESFRINDIAIDLKKQGHEVTVLTGIPDYPEGRFYPGYGLMRKNTERYKGIKIYRVPKIPRGDGNRLRLSINYLSFALMSCITGPLKCRKKYDVIFVFATSPITVALPAILIKKMTNSSALILWVQDLWPDSVKIAGHIESYIVLNTLRSMVKFIYDNCDVILGQSRSFVSSISRLSKRAKIIYYPNSAEEFYRPVPNTEILRKSLYLPDGFLVTFAGNIGEAQDFSTILSAAKKTSHLKVIKWIIVGDGRKASWVKSEIERRQLGETVFMMGRHEASKMPLFFGASDVLLAALKKSEIFSMTVPSKIQSYLACAKPIIAAMDGEGALVVREAKAGFSVPAQSPKKLAEAVISMYKLTGKERDSMGKNGLSFFKSNFEKKALIDKLQDIFTEAVNLDIPR